MNDEEFVKILRIAEAPSILYAADRIEALRAQVANLETSSTEIAERLRVALLERDYFHADREKLGAEVDGWRTANTKLRDEHELLSADFSGRTEELRLSKLQVDEQECRIVRLRDLLFKRRSSEPQHSRTDHECAECIELYELRPPITEKRVEP